MYTCFVEDARLRLISGYFGMFLCPLPLACSLLFFYGECLGLSNLHVHTPSASTVGPMFSSSLVGMSFYY